MNDEQDWAFFFFLVSPLQEEAKKSNEDRVVDNIALIARLGKEMELLILPHAY